MRRSFAYVVLFASLALAEPACTRPGGGAAAQTSPAPAADGAPSRAVSPRGLPLGDLTVIPVAPGTASGTASGATPANAPGTGAGPALRLEVEIADTPEASARGLMGVEHLSDGQGMVFLPAGPSTIPFWMKDTLIPLDVAFWDREGRIFNIQQMQPCKVPERQSAERVCPVYAPSGSYSGALEVNLGLLERSGVHPGAAVRLDRR